MLAEINLDSNLGLNSIMESKTFNSFHSIIVLAKQTKDYISTETPNKGNKKTKEE